MPSKARSGPGPRLRLPRANEGNRRDVGGTLRAAGPAPARRIARCVLEGSAPAAMGRRASRRGAATAPARAACAQPIVRRSGRTDWPARSGEFTEADLPSLPVLTRAEMMAEFDRLVTVPGLTLARVDNTSSNWMPTAYLDGEYRAIKTSGATGTEAVHVYGWDAFVTFVMQGSRWTGRRGEAPDAVLAQVFSISLSTSRGSFTPSAPSRAGGRHRTASRARPLAGLSPASTARARGGGPARVAEHHPGVGFGGVAGRLTLEPTWVSVAGEVCTPPVREAVRAAWGIETVRVLGLLGGDVRLPMRGGRRDARR